jgi:hypothetical protein
VAETLLRVSGGNVDIARGNGTGTSGSSDTVGEDLVTDLLEVAVGEDETNVAYATVSAIAWWSGICTWETHP